MSVGDGAFIIDLRDVPKEGPFIKIVVEGTQNENVNLADLTVTYCGEHCMFSLCFPVYSS